MPDDLTVVHVYPELLGTYGDRGNLLALVHRAEARGLRCRVVEVAVDAALPRLADVYVVGGGEDSAQLLARSFEDGQGRVHRGLGLLDVTCGRLPERAVGEVVSEPAGLDLPTLTGYENHSGTAALHDGAEPLGRLVAGTGNGDGRSEGVQQGHVLATYLHGPVLVRNPALADLLLTRAAGPLAPYDDPDVDRLRAERLDAADPRRHPTLRNLLGG